MDVAMAYGFVACENTTEYKMDKWYEEEKNRMKQEENTKKFSKDVGECSKTSADPVKSNKSSSSHEVVKDKATTQEETKPNEQLTIEMASQRNSKIRRSLNLLQLDDIPEADEEHLATNNAM